ncbi:hypothetical protein BC834DRAFT_535810 [Gloeopeniophorella convolvens]|nr:hypothetical protein BC834DRAFT_535810 [Gloeopeniophorella convolvens]
MMLIFYQKGSVAGFSRGKTVSRSVLAARGQQCPRTSSRPTPSAGALLPPAQSRLVIETRKLGTRTIARHRSRSDALRAYTLVVPYRYASPVMIHLTPLVQSCSGQNPPRSFAILCRDASSLFTTTTARVTCPTAFLLLPASAALASTPAPSSP